MKPDANNPAMGLQVAAKKHGSLMKHPDKTGQSQEAVYLPAFWSLDAPLPEKWQSRRWTDKGLAALFQHCSGGQNADLRLLEIDLPDDADVWAADWGEARKYGYLDEFLYAATMVRYQGSASIDHMKMPEIICFDNVPAERLSETPLPENIGRYL